MNFESSVDGFSDPGHSDAGSSPRWLGHGLVVLCCVHLAAQSVLMMNQSVSSGNDVAQTEHHLTQGPHPSEMDALGAALAPCLLACWMKRPRVWALGYTGSIPGSSLGSL